MDPDTRKRYENAMRAAQNSNQAPKMIAEHARLAILQKEEQAKLPHILPDIPMDEETRKKTAAALVSVLQGMINVSKALPRWFQVDHDEAQARRFFQAVCIQRCFITITDIFFSFFKALPIWKAISRRLQPTQC
jgi:hypothetical protein